jgi:hypothetical protein
MKETVITYIVQKKVPVHFPQGWMDEIYQLWDSRDSLEKAQKWILEQREKHPDYMGAFHHRIVKRTEEVVWEIPPNQTYDKAESKLT